MLGRVLSAEDDRPGASPAAVMSHGYWSQQWKSDPSIVNKQIVVNGTSFTVVGVMPPKFFGVKSDAHQTCGYHSPFNRKLNCDRLRSRTTESTG